MIVRQAPDANRAAFGDNDVAQIVGIDHDLSVMYLKPHGSKFVVEYPRHCDGLPEPLTIQEEIEYVTTCTVPSIFSPSEMASSTKLKHHAHLVLFEWQNRYVLMSIGPFGCVCFSDRILKV